MDIKFQSGINNKILSDKKSKEKQESIITRSNASPNKTDKGTLIVKPGEDMDKNAFLKILSAELANQDPTNPQDNTQYVTQMAQFTSLEQMANLNTTMRFYSAQSLNGKFVALNSRNAFGEQETGVIKSVLRSGSEIKLNVMTPNGQMKEFGYDKVNEILNLDDKNLDYINFINGSNLIGKMVELYAEEGKEKPKGLVKEIFRDETGIKIKVEGIDEKGNKEIKDYPYDNIMNIR